MADQRGIENNLEEWVASLKPKTKILFEKKGLKISILDDRIIKIDFSINNTKKIHYIPMIFQVFEKVFY